MVENESALQHSGFSHVLRVHIISQIYSQLVFHYKWPNWRQISRRCWLSMIETFSIQFDCLYARSEYITLIDHKTVLIASIIWIIFCMELKLIWTFVNFSPFSTWAGRYPKYLALELHLTPLAWWQQLIYQWLLKSSKCGEIMQRLREIAIVFVVNVLPWNLCNSLKLTIKTKAVRERLQRKHTKNK